MLFGDNPGDSNMADGADAGVVVRVGFLNDKVDERRALFSDRFDIVLLDDPDMGFPIELLQALLSAGGDGAG